MSLRTFIDQFLSSRPQTPIPFRPKRSDTKDNIDLSGLKLDSSPKRRLNPNQVEVLESKVNGYETAGA